MSGGSRSGFAAETRRLAPPTAGLVQRLASERGLVVVHGHPQSTRLAPHLSASSGYTLTGQSPVQKVTGLAHYFLTTPLLRGETVLVLDAANSFNPHRLASLARRRGSSTPSGMNAATLAKAYLERVRLSRAFTCFQLAELIERTPAAARRTGARRVVLTGVPDIFDDEELSDAEARAVFRRALARLRGWKLRPGGATAWAAGAARAGTLPAGGRRLPAGGERGRAVATGGEGKSGQAPLDYARGKLQPVAGGGEKQGPSGTKA
jgi:hypothetical protein